MCAWQNETSAKVSAPVLMALRCGNAKRAAGHAGRTFGLSHSGPSCLVAPTSARRRQVLPRCRRHAKRNATPLSHSSHTAFRGSLAGAFFFFSSTDTHLAAKHAAVTADSCPKKCPRGCACRPVWQQAGDPVWVWVASELSWRTCNGVTHSLRCTGPVVPRRVSCMCDRRTRMWTCEDAAQSDTPTRVRLQG